MILLFFINLYTISSYYRDKTMKKNLSEEIDGSSTFIFELDETLKLFAVMFTVSK